MSLLVHHAKRPLLALLAVASLTALAACGGDLASGDPPVATDAPDATAPESEGAADASAGDPRPAADSPAAPEPSDGGVEAGPVCSKTLTVLASVGTGTGALRSHSNGCWTVIDADGAANASFRKCSTSNHLVRNANAPNYAYDDTNPNASLSSDQTFLAQCSNGASGDGYEFMAYRGSWRLLPAPRLRAYFAELYGDGVDDVDSLWSQSGVYRGNAQLAGKKNVFPMMNVGPNASSHLEGKIHKDALAICKTIANKGYFGTYVATYASPMPADDPRVLALANALNACTK